MANDNKNYIYKDDAGVEHGPYDEATFQSLGTNGTILPHYPVRSTLIPVWEKASDSRVSTDPARLSMFSQCPPAAQGNTFPIRRTGWAGWLAMGSVPPAAPHPKDMASHPRASGDGEWGVGPRVCTCPAGTSLTSVWITT